MIVHYFSDNFVNWLNSIKLDLFDVFFFFARVRMRSFVTPGIYISVTKASHPLPKNRIRIDRIETSVLEEKRHLCFSRCFRAYSSKYITWNFIFDEMET